MALMFGEDLDDIGADEQALAEFLRGAQQREREDVGAGDAARDDDRESWGLPDDSDDGREGFEQDPAADYRDPRRTLGERLIPDGIGEASASRVTAAVRKDVRAKTALFLSALGTAWSRRDPVCGGVALESVAPVSDALADIFCDSPDIVRWFTASGKYMKWFTLITSLQAVGEAVIAHHVTHTVDEAGAAPDWSAYSAGG